MAGRKPGTKKTGGRTKGTPNKLSSTVKNMVLAALDKAGGEKYLLEQAKSNPTAFLTLIGKVLPTEISGPDGGPVEVTGITVKLVKKP